MIKNGNRVNINREKLRELIKKTHMSNQEFSMSLGRDGSYINKVLRDKTYNISRTDYLLIKSMYGVDIKSDEIKKKISDEDIQEATQVVKDLSPNELSALIYKAIYGGVSHALEDKGGQL